MRQLDRRLDRTLNLLRNKIRQRGYTQLEVQEVLGWGRSYISQLLNRQKSLRIEQVLLVLDVIGVDPADFFAEIFPLDTSDQPVQPFSGDASIASLRGEYQSARSLLRGLVDVLVNQKIITAKELSSAVSYGLPLPGASEDL